MDWYRAQGVGNSQWADTLESLNPENQSLSMTKRLINNLDPNFSLEVPGSSAYSDSEQALGDNLESQF